VLEQVVADNDVAGRSSGELFVFFLLGVGLVMDDKIDDGCSQVVLDDEYLLSLSWYQVWLGGRVLLELHRGAVEPLDKHSYLDKSLFGSKFGEDICYNVMVPKDVVEL
jgi:hypothetical protein